jgi:hypothetical protein
MTMMRVAQIPAVKREFEIVERPIRRRQQERQ